MHGERNAEVGNERMRAVGRLLQQNVFRLDVAVHNAHRVGFAERIRYRDGDGQGISHRQLRFPLESRAQRLAAHVGHDVEEQSIGRAAVEQSENMRMLQPRRGADFAQEAVAAEGRAEIRMQHLDRDITIVLEIMREIYRGHATLAELALDAVAVGQRGVQPNSDVGHARGT